MICLLPTSLFSLRRRCHVTNTLGVLYEHKHVYFFVLCRLSLLRMEKFVANRFIRGANCGLRRWRLRLTDIPVNVLPALTDIPE